MGSPSQAGTLGRCGLVWSSTLTMGSRRRSRGSRRGSSYLPVVVLNNQQPYMESRSETVNHNKVEGGHKNSNIWPGKFSVKDLTFGLLGGSSSSPDPMRSSSSLSGSYSGGGCSSGGGGFDTLLFLAALAAAVFFLNQAIVMNIGRKRRRFSDQEQTGVLQAGIEEFEEKIEEWGTEIDEDSSYSWIFPLIKQFYGESLDDQKSIVDDKVEEDTEKDLLKLE